MNKVILCSIVAISFFLHTALFAETIQQKFNNLTLNAEFKSVNQDKNKPIFLIIHGTLAFNKMEIIVGMQEYLADINYNSLAVNLSYGMDNRKSSFYDCTKTFTHTNEDGIAEIGYWYKWLSNQGYTHIIILGHSRGGNQVARYAKNNKLSQNTQLILLAPATWEYEKSKNSFEQSNKIKLEKLINSKEKKFKLNRFIYCQNTTVTKKSLASYYANNTDNDTPTVLKDVQTNALIIIASNDETVVDLPSKMKEIAQSKNNINVATIEDSDHFFRDFFIEDAIDLSIKFIAQ